MTQLVPCSFQSLPESRTIKWLEQIIDRVDFERAKGELVVRGDKDHRGHRVLGYLLQNPESVQAWHLHVEQNDVGRLLLDHGHGARAVHRFADDFEILLDQEGAQFFPRERFIIHDQYANVHG